MYSDSKKQSEERAALFAAGDVKRYRERRELSTAAPVHPVAVPVPAAVAGTVPVLGRCESSP